MQTDIYLKVLDTNKQVEIEKTKSYKDISYTKQ